MQATGKAIRLKLLRFHVATGSDRYYRNGLRLGEIRCTQQFQQVEATYRRHLHIGEQYVKSPERKASSNSSGCMHDTEVMPLC